MDLSGAYRVALLDWLACAAGGAGEPAARAARAAGDGVLDRVAFAGTAGHALDFDDTYVPGLAHLSAPTAPVALVLAAALDRSIGDALTAYAAGFEAMGAFAAANHPALYDRGWHPTAVCGSLGAAVTAARLLGLDTERERSARALALLRAGGMRAGFGSDGKALGVGMAAVAGVQAARFAEAGARVPLERVADGPAGLLEAFGGAYAEPEAGAEPAVVRNWIKAYPCCLQTHGAIDAAEQARTDGTAGQGVEAVVHPLSRQAAPYDDAETPLQAKFSIPYTVAFTLLHGPPTVDAFAAVEPAARALARARVRVETDPALAESEAVLRLDGAEAARVRTALGSPERPMDAAQLAAKVRNLAGDRLDGVLDDSARPAADALAAAKL
ncbi:MAG TPA: MmgE/PrpD family protein [Solirubrobacteraceae bacterium]|nr:MmgE/PrpD family protein [Solirubrobacteraceae bacterium]